MRVLMLSNEPPEFEATPSDIPSIETEISSLNTDIAEDHTRIAELSSALDSAEDAMQTVGVAADGMEATLPSGGMSESGVKVLQQSLEHLLSKLGYQSTLMRCSLESYADKQDRQASTRLAIEDLRETAKKIWEKIKAAFRKLIEWIKGLFVKKSAKFEALERKAIALKSVIEEKKKKKEVSFEEAELTSSGSTGDMYSSSQTKKKEGTIEYPPIFADYNRAMDADDILYKIQTANTLLREANSFLSNSDIRALTVRNLEFDLTHNVGKGAVEVLRRTAEKYAWYYKVHTSSHFFNGGEKRENTVDGVKVTTLANNQFGIGTVISTMPEPGNFEKLLEQLASSETENEAKSRHVVHQMNALINSVSCRFTYPMVTTPVGKRLEIYAQERLLANVAHEVKISRELTEQYVEHIKVYEKVLRDFESLAQRFPDSQDTIFVVVGMTRTLLNFFTQVMNAGISNGQAIYSGFFEVCARSNAA